MSTPAPAPEREQAPEQPRTSRRLHLGPWLPTRSRVRVRDIGAMSGSDRRAKRGPTWIGHLAHHDHPDAPAPYQVVRYGGTTYGRYLTEQEAMHGADEYARGFLTLRATRQPFHLSDVHPPVVDRPSRDLIDALACERNIAGLRIQRILDECTTEGTLRDELTRYAARLRGGGVRS